MLSSGKIDDVSDDAIVVDLDVFEKNAHARLDARVRESVLSCAQCIAKKPRVAARGGESEHWQSRNNKGSRIDHQGRRAPRSGDAFAAGRGTRCTPSPRGPAQDEQAWTRRAKTTLMGLCNRVSESNLESIIPKILNVTRSYTQPRDVVCTIMKCMERSDTYVHMYVRILESAKCVDGIDGAITDYTHKFLDQVPFKMPCAPDPLLDYDGFCASVKEKRRRVNATEAIVRLGFGDAVADWSEDALNLVADPCSECQKDLAVRFLRTAVDHGGPCVPDVCSVRNVLKRSDECGLDTQTRFALADLADSMQRMSKPPTLFTDA